MAEPYIGEIKMFGGNFAPSGYALCDGETLSISQNDALFALIGTTFGGDGQLTFKLPDLQGRIPIHQSPTYPIGQVGGTETVTLTAQNLPSHTHTVIASSKPGTSVDPKGNIVAAVEQGAPFYYRVDNNPWAPDGQMGNQSIGPMGGNQPHDNMMPYLCITFIIALNGLWPPQN